MMNARGTWPNLRQIDQPAQSDRKSVRENRERESSVTLGSKTCAAVITFNDQNGGIGRR